MDNETEVEVQPHEERPTCCRPLCPNPVAEPGVRCSACRAEDGE